MNVSTLNLQVNLDSITLITEHRQNASKFIFYKIVVELFYINCQHLTFHLHDAFAYYTLILLYRTRVKRSLKCGVVCFFLISDTVHMCDSLKLMSLHIANNLTT